MIRESSCFPRFSRFMYLRKAPAPQHDWQTKRGVLGSFITVIKGMALFTSTVGRKRKASRGGRGNVDPETRPEYAIFESADPLTYKQRESRTLVPPEHSSPFRFHAVGTMGGFRVC